MYPVYDISGFESQLPVSIGSKEKRWVMPPEGHELPRRQHLFKIGRPDTGENWAEKVTGEIGRTIGLPCATYNFAISGDDRGVISRNFLPKSGRLYLGNVLMAQIVSGYDEAKKFKQIDYKLDSVLNLIRRIDPRAPLDWENSLAMAAHEVFVGYLVFDGLIGNTDRHHENWGFVTRREENELGVYLAPSFDHASSLGRNESAAKRKLRLTTKDERATVEAYASRGRCAFFGAGASAETLTMRGMIEELIALYPRPMKLWAERVAGLTRQALQDIFIQVSSDWISDDAAEFAIRMLLCNQAMITEVALV